MVMKLPLASHLLVSKTPIATSWMEFISKELVIPLDISVVWGSAYLTLSLTGSVVDAYLIAVALMRWRRL